MIKEKRKCPFCDKYYSLSLNSRFLKHLNTVHQQKLTKEHYFDLYLRKSPQEGFCLTCGKPTTFRKQGNLKFTYKEYCDGTCVLKNINFHEQAKQIKLERYGDENYNNREKAELTCLERYGETSFAKTSQYIDKTKKTCNEKYGCDYYLQTEDIKIKTKETCNIKYNCDNYRQTQQYKDSYRETCLRKYGKESVNQVEEIKQKKIDTNLKKTGYEWPLLNPDILKKIEQTEIEKYGTSNVTFGSEYAILKSQETCLERYGTSFPMQSKQIQEKCKRKYIYNSVYFDSSYELAYYIWLKDHNIDFEYHNSVIEYKINEETHYYFPDFKVNNEYIELKGSHLIDENMNLIHPKTKEILKEKTQCLKDNNVKIIVDCSEYINYIKNKYGEHFISSLKTSFQKLQKSLSYRDFLL